MGVLAHVTATNKPNAVGLYAKGKGAAAVLDGDVFVHGNLTVARGFKLTVVTPANKHGVVELGGGSEHLVCAIESPEAWLEDFGETSLVNGKHTSRWKRALDGRSMPGAITLLDCIRRSAGLSRLRRTASGFDVAERKPGKSNVRFSWRVVAKPKHAQHKRFDKATTPRALERVLAAVARHDKERRLEGPALKADDVASALPGR